MDINVTKPFFPSLDEYKIYLEGIWERCWLTNNGALVNELESKLKVYLGVNNLLFVTNGTIAIQIAIKALGLKGDIITTPFSFVATASTLVWEGCTPVFVDIDAKTWNIDADKIEAAITPNTVAILATHVFGNPCDIEEMDSIAKRYKLKIIYDAAHCFGVNYKGKSVYNYGDISTTSFHATKVFHTAEGGAIITTSDSLHKRMDFMRNFGHNGPGEFAEVGINGKNSELHAAMGLAVLPYMSRINAERQRLTLRYQHALSACDVKMQQLKENIDYNFAYMPVVFRSERVVLDLISKLKEVGVSPRRYFFPSLSKLHYVSGAVTPVSDDISQRILCLPLYSGLEDKTVDQVCKIISQHC